MGDGRIERDVARSYGEAVSRREIKPLHFNRRSVDVAVVDDGAIGRRGKDVGVVVARMSEERLDVGQIVSVRTRAYITDEGRERRVVQGVDQVLSDRGRDPVLERGPEPAAFDPQAFERPWRPDEPGGPGFGGFRKKVRIASILDDADHIGARPVEEDRSQPVGAVQLPQGRGPE